MTICIKKNKNIHKAHRIQFNIAISDKFTPKIYLNKKREAIITINIKISHISLSHFNIIKYNHIIMAIDNIIDEIHIVKLGIQELIFSIIFHQGVNV
jgi:hypothetical protein